MEQNITLNNKSAVKIEAVVIKALDKASLYDCEGDEVWVPHSISQYNEKEETLIIEEWFFEKLEEEGKL